MHLCQHIIKEAFVQSLLGTGHHAEGSGYKSGVTHGLSALEELNKFHFSLAFILSIILYPKGVFFFCVSCDSPARERLEVF